MNLSRTRIIWSVISFVVVVAGAITLWSYVTSFQDVTFHFDQRQGYIELTGDDKQPLYPRDNQLVKLKKGAYHARNIGTRIAEESRTIQVDGSRNSYNITFNFTRSYLDQLLIGEQSAIQSALYSKYPQAQSDYELRSGRLYHRGELYGAILVARDQMGDNADTLRVMLQKDERGWQVRSLPPMPILSAPLYPSIDRAVLSDINRAR